MMTDASLDVTQAAGVAARRWLVRLASLKFALAILALLGAGVLAAYWNPAHGTWPIAVPLGLFAVNLGSAVLANATFRRQTALLVFHLALMAIVLLAAAGRLTYLKGQVELSTGETFSGTLTQSERGPWHSSRLDRISFTNEGFTVAYSPGMRRNETRNAVTWSDQSGRRYSRIIGDQQPLTLDGYRFYTSFNKGFAPLFTWQPTQGAPRRGTIHLPSYPLHQYGQALEWNLPDTDFRLWVMLEFDEVLIDPQRRSEFRLPARHRLVLRASGERRELAPGARYETPHGVLVYEGLTTWMGYTVFYDWTAPWLLAACLLAVLALAAHFRRKFVSRPWDASHDG